MDEEDKERVLYVEEQVQSGLAWQVGRLIKLWFWLSIPALILMKLLLGKEFGWLFAFGTSLLVAKLCFPALTPQHLVADIKPGHIGL